jgi:hypothetical protein
MAAVLVVYVIYFEHWSGLVGLPLIFISMCACAQNLNCIDGCLPFLLAIVVFVIGLAMNQTGLVVAAAVCEATWILTSLEAAWRVPNPRACLQKHVKEDDERGEEVSGPAL